MKFLQHVIPWGLLGVFLSLGGITVLTWQFWAVLFTVMLIDIQGNK